jgi:tetraacyldisaccharide 4'-kinase
MVEYLVKLLSGKYEVATLSRGYKRKTKGFAVAAEDTSAVDIGDEPMQIHQKFPNITVAVAEERVIGIPQLLFGKPKTEIIILDDAFQHREVKAGLNVLLTDYNNLYYKDILLPAGDLRDIKSSSKRAEIIIVTKCKPDLNTTEKNKIIDELRPLSNQKIFFTKIAYNTLYHLFTKETYVPDPDSEVLLICGIANPQPIKTILASEVASYELLQYKDHHIFNTDDLKEIKQHFEKIKNKKKFIVTTEKDAVRLAKFEKELATFPVYVLPMEHQFLFDEAREFQNEVIQFVESFKKV